MLNDKFYEGRFSPRVNGKRISKNIYATTREECEEKLVVLIKTMQAKIADEKKRQNRHSKRGDHERSPLKIWSGGNKEYL